MRSNRTQTYNGRYLLKLTKPHTKPTNFWKWLICHEPTILKKKNSFFIYLFVFVFKYTTTNWNHISSHGLSFHWIWMETSATRNIKFITTKLINSIAANSSTKHCLFSIHSFLSFGETYYSSSLCDYIFIEGY